MTYDYNDKSVSTRRHLYNCVAGTDDFCKEWINSKSDNECDILWADLTSFIKARKERSNKAIGPAFDEWLKIHYPTEYQRRQNMLDELWSGKHQELVDYDKLNEKELLLYWKLSLNKIERHMFSCPEWEAWSEKAEASLVKWLQMKVSQERIDQLDISVFEKATEYAEAKLMMTVDAQGFVIDEPLSDDELFAEWKAENKQP
ncbi:hypothetical protein [Paracoccus endophyticus]|uniref:hypothetical protein n=1 Tax=Paracoccus endophyticus TaxID=2233774 RepID=UPI0013A6C690|nr:hypothetical protein [Paracoccus endophyticus]